MKKVIRFYDDKTQLLNKVKENINVLKSDNDFNVEYFSFDKNKELKNMISNNDESEYNVYYILLDTIWDECKQDGYPEKVYQEIISSVNRDNKYYVIFYTTLWDDPIKAKKNLEELIQSEGYNNVVVCKNWIKIYGTTPGLWEDTFQKIKRTIVKLEEEQNEN